MNRNSHELQNCLELIGLPFSVIGLTETWLDESNESSNNIPNYTTINATRTDRVGGGISLHIRNNLHFKRYPIQEMNRNIECLFIEVICPNPRNNIIVGVIYRPPSGGITNFTTAMAEILRKISSKHKTCYLLGDFNIDLKKYHTTRDIAEFYDLLYT